MYNYIHNIRRFGQLIVLGVTLLFSSGISAESVTLKLDPVPQFQDDSWSCGIHSAYRSLLGGYGQVDYISMRSTVTSYNPMRIVLVPGVVEFDLNFANIGGEPTDYLANSLRTNYRPSTVSQTASSEQIKDLLWTGRPIMMLEQVGVAGGGTASGCIGGWLWGSCWGIQYSVNANYPTLHWEVAVGYDQTYLYFKTTTDNLYS